MNPQQHARAKRIFARALRVDQESRARFVRSECRNDTALAADVTELLEHHHSDTLLQPHEKIDQPPPPVRTRRARSVRTVVVLGSLVGLFWLGLAIHRDLTRTTQRNRGVELSAALSADVAELVDTMDTWKHEAETWKSDPMVARHVEALIDLYESGASRSTLWSSEARYSLYRALGPYLARPENVWAVVVSTDGVLVADPGRAEYIGLRVNRSAAAAVSDALAGGTTFLSPYIEDGGATRARTGFGRGRPVAAMLASVKDGSGSPIAVLAFGRFVETAFDGGFAGARRGRTGETYAVDENGSMISKSRFEPELRRLGLVPEGANDSAILNVHVRDPGGDLSAGFSPVVELAARPLTRAAALAIASRDQTERSSQRGVVTESYRNYVGASVIGAWAWLPEHRIGVISEVRSEEAFAVLAYLDAAAGVWFAGLFIAAIGVVVSAARALHEAKRTEPARRVGPYRLERLIGEGGMGQVYLAEHARLHRPTAVKILARSRVAAQDVTRFEREVRAASGLSHPNTIDIYDYGSTKEGVFYYAMEYVRGPTLAALVAKSGRVPVGRAIHILEQICQSLREAHEHGLVHRDIKPLNVMLCRRGGRSDVVKVLDFGLVKRLESNTEVTGPMQLGGTPLYMAPERVRDHRCTDVRSDIYAVGAVGYFLLAGMPMFDAETNLELLNKVVTETPPRLECCDLSDTVSEIVMSCVAKSPDARPQTMAELLVRLSDVSKDHPWTDEQAQAWWEVNGDEF